MKENNGKTIAAATHGGVIRCLICRLTKGSIYYLNEINWSINTAITLLEFDDKLNPRVVYINDISHLPERLIPEYAKVPKR